MKRQKRFFSNTKTKNRNFKQSPTRRRSARDENSSAGNATWQTQLHSLHSASNIDF